MQFKIRSWIIEIGFGIGLLLLASLALLLAMEHHPQIPQPHSSTRQIMPGSSLARTIIPLGNSEAIG
ncbi:hypothetical protein [Leptolyngbya sp. FACHB-711]|uniref:hypothetical protein n=1 Tax=unclassified Leptolyngbya TaxID=2650499 RepID=UPI0016893072|nr:hypothetical protein [Leptolyngbya sp. FACHB-711]MBD1848708.1 hypothetical protein [Cyanobacteria bacterium FACHB-502]MBD2025953.1 hypothetical protein [Leptolyngbya sp. FACHB-711]